MTKIFICQTFFQNNRPFGLNFLYLCEYSFPAPHLRLFCLRTTKAHARWASVVDFSFEGMCADELDKYLKSLCLMYAIGGESCSLLKKFCCGKIDYKYK